MLLCHGFLEHILGDLMNYIADVIEVTLYQCNWFDI